MKIAVCDDEINVISATCKLLQEWAGKHAVPLTLYRFTNGDDLLAAHHQYCMDLILLDVVMPLLNGIDTARELRQKDTAVHLIFLTSSREFAADSYDVDAFYYLLKPIDKDKFFLILDRFLDAWKKSEDTFMAQTALGFSRIRINDVEYLEAQNKEVRVYLSDGSQIDIRELFSRCEEVFSPARGFYKCHRSYIVHLSHVAQFTRTTITTSQHASIPISRNSYAAFKEAYFQHMFQS